MKSRYSQHANESAVSASATPKATTASTAVVTASPPCLPLTRRQRLHETPRRIDARLQTLRQTALVLGRAEQVHVSRR